MASVNILANLPSNFFTLAKSEAWSARAVALQALAKQLHAARLVGLDQDVDYGMLMAVIKEIICNDDDLLVVTLAVRCLSKIASGLSTYFDQYVPMFMTALFEKYEIKNALVHEAVTECVDAIASTVHPDELISLFDAVVKQCKNSDVKIGIDHFYYRTLLPYTAHDMPKRFIANFAPYIREHMNDVDPKVNDAACKACAALMRLFGRGITTALVYGWDDDKANQQKVLAYCKKAVEEASDLKSFIQTNEQFAAGDGCLKRVGYVKVKGRYEAICFAVSDEEWELMNAVKLLKLLPRDFLKILESKEWKYVLKSLKDLNILLKRIKLHTFHEDYGQLVDALNNVLGKHTNMGVAAMAAKCLKGIVAAIGYEFAQYSAKVMGTALLKFKEKSAMLRESLLGLIDSIALVTPFALYADVVKSSMMQVSPKVKAQTTLFVAKLLRQHNVATTPSEFITLAPLIKTLTRDRDAEVRDASYAAIGAAMKSFTKEQIGRYFKDVFDDKLRAKQVKREYCDTLKEYGLDATEEIVRMEEHFWNLPISSLKIAAQKTTIATLSSKHSTCLLRPEQHAKVALRLHDPRNSMKHGGKVVESQTTSTQQNFAHEPKKSDVDSSGRTDKDANVVNRLPKYVVQPLKLEPGSRLPLLITKWSESHE